MNKEQLAFLDEWKKNHDEDIDSVHMICLRGAQDDLLALGLNPSARQKELWGLLVFGSKKLSFFIPASESSIMGMFRTTSGGKPPQDQLVVLSNFLPLAVIAPPKKNLLKWLTAPSEDFFLRVGVNGRIIQLSVLCHEKVVSLPDKIQAWLNDHKS